MRKAKTSFTCPVEMMGGPAFRDSVERFKGSISAEHGLGVLKREEIRRYKSAVEINLMLCIKRALDPDNLMNPGKVI